ncbi:MAG: beta-ketoacyl-[acyl-carrier-protein] synthase family protein [Syntrophaceae bacterium]|nr:beta-ketoacyl-[acyl-carrier-protein] synthase family protein [Syntrophaceae bacterium]
MKRERKRVVITGAGPITPVGSGKEAYWESLIQGRSSFQRISFPDRDMSQYRCQVAAPIQGFDLFQYVDRTRHSKYLGRTSQFAIAATWLALKDAGIELLRSEDEKENLREQSGTYQLRGLDPFQVGVILGIGAEAMELMEHYHERFLSRGPRGISPFALPNIYLSSITSHVANYFTIRGTAYAVSTACASSTHAMINSFLEIRDGREEIMVTGGADACITSYVFAGFDVLRAMSTRNEDPQKACRPFDRTRDGFVMGEGSGVLIFEELEHARRRGAHIYGEVVGFGMTADAYHLTDPDPDGKALAKAIRDALQMADLRPEEVDYINPHGTSTPVNDKVETRVIKDVFGKYAYSVPISSTKSITGHLMGAAGAAEAIALLLAIERRIVHPTINYEFPDPECDLDYVPNQAREKEVRVGLSISAGFGGVNSAILIKKFE